MSGVHPDSTCSLQMYLDVKDRMTAAEKRVAELSAPIPMLITCPACRVRHVDEGEFATKPHHTHACQACGMCWRPAVPNTVGVRFLPGFKNEGS